ncbi:hypothetical protein LEP3755_35500 [Leptolyngbya sp. NIES-3755]|nr:hypothetical protein LEP3755_35500 [Leptolyngbya sp. NIES-3755]
MGARANRTTGQPSEGFNYLPSIARLQAEALRQRQSALQLPPDRNITSAVKILAVSDWDFDKRDKTEAMKILLEVGWTYEEITAVLNQPLL